MQSIRERLVIDRRRRRLRKLRLFVFLLILCLALTFAWKALHRPGFAFGDLKVRGTKLITAEELIAVGGGGKPFNFFNVSLSRIEEALAQDVRFKSSQVRYRWPAGVEVIVEERRPALYVASSYDSYLQVDFEGVVLKVVTGIPDAGVPVLSGVECGNVFTGDRIEKDTVLAVLDFLAYIGPEASELAAELAVDGQGVVRLLLKDSFPVILGEAAGLREKAPVFLSVFKEIRGKDIRARYIDLTYDRPYIRLLPKKEEEPVVAVEPKKEKTETKKP